MSDTDTPAVPPANDSEEAVDPATSKRYILVSVVLLVLIAFQLAYLFRSVPSSLLGTTPPSAPHGHRNGEVVMHGKGKDAAPPLPSVPVGPGAPPGQGGPPPQPGGPPGGQQGPQQGLQPSGGMNNPIDLAASVLALEETPQALTAAQKAALHDLLQQYYENLRPDYAATRNVVNVLSQKQRQVFFTPHEMPSVDAKDVSPNVDPFMTMAIEVLEKKAGATPAIPVPTPTDQPSGPDISPDKGYFSMQIVYLESKSDLALDAAQARRALDVLKQLRESAKKEAELKQKIGAVLTPAQQQALAGKEIIKSPDVVILQLLTTSLKSR